MRGPTGGWGASRRRMSVSTVAIATAESVNARRQSISPSSPARVRPATTPAGAPLRMPTSALVSPAAAAVAMSTGRTAAKAPIPSDATRNAA